jgi:stearoyl-CoA desaturase (delta-9 desaturase)
MIVGLTYVIQTGLWSWLLLSIIVHFFIGALGVSCGFHRLLSHKSFKTNRFWEIFLTLCGTYSTVGTSITWVNLHGSHHVHSDKPGDPHSPYVVSDKDQTRKISFKQLFKLWLNFFKVDNYSTKYVRNMLNDPFHKFLHVHYYKVIFSTMFVLFLINPWLVIFAYAIPACMAFHFTSVIVTVAHIHGYRTYNTSDESRNSWIASIFTYGDGWHNNHHAKPGNWLSQEKWWELDPCGWFIWLIKK